MEPIILRDVFDPATLPAGTYQATSDSVAYPLLRYLVITGFAKLVWEQALPAGRIQITAEVPQGASETTFRAKPAKPRADVDLTRWDPDRDRKGQPVKPGDLVSVKTYPKGTARGRLVVSTRSWTVADDGSKIASLDVLTDDGVRYSSPTSKALLLLARGNPIEEPAEAAESYGQMQFTRKWAEENVKKDYVDWMIAWWREAIQNSVDAKASLVALSTTEQPDGTWMIVCDDNGSGMTTEQVEDAENGFLAAMGGTSKLQLGLSTGAFGKAKELLLLPWIKYQVFNRDKRYIGTMNTWRRWEAPMRAGVRIEVIMPKDLRTDDLKAKQFLDWCWIPQTSFTINGERYKTRLPTPTDPVDLIQDHPMGMIYKISKGGPPKVYVRKNGIWMFSMPFEGRNYNESLLVEVTADSKTAFTQNRDHFNNHDLSETITRIVGQMTKETIQPRRALAEYKDFPCPSIDLAAARATRIQLALGTLPPIGKEGAKFDKKAIESLRTIVSEFETQDHESGFFLGIPDPDAATEIVTNMIIGGQSSYDAACKQLVWPQQFATYKYPKWPIIAKRFEPGHMSASLHRLARVWGEIVRYVLILLGTSKECGIGWVFAHEVAGLSLVENGKRFIMINPIKSPVSGPEGDILDPSNPNDLRKLYSIALHELTHSVNGISYHDEKYSSALTDNIEKAALGISDLRGLVKGIKARLPEKLRPVRIAATGTKPTGPLKGDVEAYLALRVLSHTMRRWSWDPEEAAKALGIVLNRLGFKPMPPRWYSDDAKKRGALIRMAAVELHDKGNLVLDRGVLLFGGEHGTASAHQRQYVLVSDGSKALNRWEAIQDAERTVRQQWNDGTIKWEGFSSYDLDDLVPLVGQRTDSQWDADAVPNAASIYTKANDILYHLGSLDGPYWQIRRSYTGAREGKIGTYTEAASRLAFAARDIVNHLSIDAPIDAIPAELGVEMAETGTISLPWMQLSRNYVDGKDHLGLSTTRRETGVIWNIARRINEVSFRDYVMDFGRVTAEATWETNRSRIDFDLARVANIVFAVEDLTQLRKEYEMKPEGQRAEFAEASGLSARNSLESLALALFGDTAPPTEYPANGAQMGSLLVASGVTMLPNGFEFSILRPDYRGYDVYLFAGDAFTQHLWLRAGATYAHGLLRRPYHGDKATFYAMENEAVAASQG